MEFKELKKKEDKELIVLLGKTKEELQTMLFKVSAGQFKNIRAIRKAKKMIAQILTLKNQQKNS